MIYIDTKINIHRYNGGLVIIIKFKDKENVHVTGIVLYCVKTTRKCIIINHSETYY
jgi:hypothetical protein